MSSTSFKFGLNDVKIAAWSSASSWGTAVDIEAVRSFVVNVQTQSGILEGDDHIAAAAAKAISVQVQFQFGFKDLTAYATMTGMTHESSGNDRSMTFLDTAFPYFGLAGRIDDDDSAGNDVLFIPKVKLMEGFELRGEFGQFVTPNLTAMGVYNDATYGFFEVYQYAANTAIAFPPTAIGS